MTHVPPGATGPVLHPSDLPVPHAVRLLALLEDAIGNDRGPFVVAGSPPRLPRKERLHALAVETVVYLWERGAFDALTADPDPERDEVEAAMTGDPARVARVVLALEAVSFALGDAAVMGDRGGLVDVLRREGNQRARELVHPDAGLEWHAEYRGAVDRLETAMLALTPGDGGLVRDTANAEAD